MWGQGSAAKQSQELFKQLQAKEAKRKATLAKKEKRGTISTSTTGSKTKAQPKAQPKASNGGWLGKARDRPKLLSLGSTSTIATTSTSNSGRNSCLDPADNVIHSISSDISLMTNWPLQAECAHAPSATSAKNTSRSTVVSSDAHQLDTIPDEPSTSPSDTPSDTADHPPMIVPLENTVTLKAPPPQEDNDDEEDCFSLSSSKMGSSVSSLTQLQRPSASSHGTKKQHTFLSKHKAEELLQKLYHILRAQEDRELELNDLLQHQKLVAVERYRADNEAGALLAMERLSKYDDERSRVMLVHDTVTEAVVGIRSAMNRAETAALGSMIQEQSSDDDGQQPQQQHWYKVDIGEHRYIFQRIEEILSGDAPVHASVESIVMNSPQRQTMLEQLNMMNHSRR